MKKSFTKCVCSLTMISFISMCMMSSAPAFSAVKTGSVKPKIVESKYKKEQEYKSKKLDILLTKQVQTYGSGYNSYYPGYYSILGGYGWSNTSSVAYESVDFKIIQGGVQEISDSTFAKLTGDTELKARINRAWQKHDDSVDAMNRWSIFGTIFTGVCLAAYLLTEPTAKTKTNPGGMGTKEYLGVGTIMGGVMMFTSLYQASTVPEPSGHFIRPGDAAKIAFNYNQELKSSLGLPEDFEPPQN